MTANNELWTVGKILKWTENYFKEKGVETPRLDAEVLLAKVLKRERIYLYVHFDEPLQPDELASFREMIKKRVAHMPVAYILGEKEFMGLKFKVTPATLVPRPDTEILVQRAVELLRAKKADDSEVRFADIGTGSGAICLSVLNFVPNTVADTVDISEAARKVAEKVRYAHCAGPGMEQGNGQPGRKEIHTLLYGRISFAFERGTDRSLFRGDLEAFS